MNADEVADLLSRFRQGEVDAEAVVAELLHFASPPSAQTADAHVDVDRHRRCGFPEVVFGEGKATAAVVEVFETLVKHNQSCFATRLSEEQATGLLARFPKAEHNVLARTVRLSSQLAPREGHPLGPRGRVAVITAGTSDRPVAEEAMETLRWMGCGCELIVDVGVAGPHRLREHQPRFDGADAVVVVAGMEGALPSVVGGFVDCPVIAVPTSVGYGASFGGTAALLGMLNSCAANVTVVNIDAGFKGGYVAGLIALRAAERE